MISFNQALFLFTLEVGWLCWLYSFFKSYRFWKYALGGTMLSMLRLWLLYLSVIVLGSFHPVISLPCIYWRKIVLFSLLIFTFIHCRHSLVSCDSCAMVCQSKHLLKKQTKNKPNLPCQISWCAVACEYFSECECGARASVSTIFSYHPPLEILRDSSYQFSSLHCSRGHLPYSGNGFVLPDLNGPELQHNLLASLLLLEYLALHSAILSSEWFILE